MGAKESSAGLPPKEGGKRGKRAPPSRTLSRYQQLGPMPDDPLKINEWSHRALGVAMLHTVNDPQMDEHERIGRMCEIAGRMKDLTPMSRLSKAEDVVMGRTAAGASGPQMTPAKPDAPKKPNVDPAAGGPPALRGGPRRRSTR